MLIVVPGSFHTPNFVPGAVGGTPIPSYAPLRGVLEAVLQVARDGKGATARGDPARGMGVVIDVVCGEGRAKETLEKNGWPLWLFLGDDAVRDVRARVTRMARVLDQWEDTVSDVSFLNEKALASL